MKRSNAKFPTPASSHSVPPATKGTTSTDEQLREFRKKLAPFTSAGAWNTELFYLQQADYRDHYTSSLFEAHHAAARFLIDLGEGIAQSCPVHIDSVWKKTIHERFRAFTSLNGIDGTFSAIGVAYNPLARFFEGAKPIGKFRYPNGIICYVFQRDGKEIAAVWNYASRRDLSADFSPFEVMDLFGNPISSGVLPLTPAPYYLRPKHNAPGFGDLLKNLAVRMEQIVQVQPAARLIPQKDGASVLRVTLYNTGNRNAECRAGLSGRLFCPQGVQAFTIPAGQSVTLNLPCRIRTPGGEAFLGLFADGKTFRIPLTITENPLLNTGETAEFQSKDGKLSGTFRFERKGKELELTVCVKDPTDSGTEMNGRAPWEQDCVELFFDRRSDTSALEHPEKYTQDVFRLFLLPRLKKANVHFMDHPVKTTVSDLPCQVQHTADGYILKLTIPERLLPANQQEFGFEIKVDDAETLSGKPVREASWANGDRPFRNRLAFGIIQSAK